MATLAKADLPPCLHAFGRLLQHYREVMYEELCPDLIAKILEEVRGSLRQVHYGLESVSAALSDRVLPPVYWSVCSGRPAALEGVSKGAVRLDLQMGDASSIGKVLRSQTSFVPSPGSRPGKPLLTSPLSAATDNSKLVGLRSGLLTLPD